VEVEDGSPSLLPILGKADGTRGCGLLLINRLAQNWGCDRQGDRKVVWAEVPSR
jgi:hypothetical protein